MIKGMLLVHVATTRIDSVLASARGGSHSTNVQEAVERNAVEHEANDRRMRCAPFTGIVEAVEGCSIIIISVCISSPTAGANETCSCQH
jgi:hypothetical protein